MIRKVFPVLIVSIMLFVSCATGQVKVTKLGDLPKEIDLKNLPTAEQYPDSDAVILYENIVYDVDYVPAKGIETYKTYHRVYRIFGNESGYMTNVLSFDEHTEFESFSARTIKPDGTIKDLKQDDIYKGTFVRKHKAFEGKNHMVSYNFPDLKKGDIIEIKYTVINRYFYFEDVYWIQSRLPKNYTRFEIRIPNFVFDLDWAYSFNFKINNIDVPQPTVTKGFGDSGDRSYVFENRNIPQFISEKKMGPDFLYMGNIDLQMASWKTWNGYARDHYERNYLPVLDKMSDEEKEMVKMKAAELTKGMTNDIDKIKALKKYVQTFNYSDTAVYFGNHVKPNNIKTIMEREYGDCKDHTVVLIALLREIGVKAWPALARSANPDAIDPEFVSNIFNHVLVKVILDGGQILWLDPTYKYAAFGELSQINEDTYALEMRPKKDGEKIKLKLERTPKSNYSDNLYEKRVSGQIEKDNVIYNVKIKLTGNAAMSDRWYFEDISQRETKKMIRKRLPYFMYDAEINDVKTENLHNNDLPFFYSYTIKIKVPKKGSIPVVPVEFFNDPVSLTSVYEQTRTKPIFLGSPYKTLETYEFNYDPSKYSVQGVNNLVNSEFSEGESIKLKLQSENEPGKILFTVEYSQIEKKIGIKNVTSYLKKLKEFVTAKKTMYWTVLMPVNEKEKPVDEKAEENQPDE